MASESKNLGQFHLAEDYHEFHIDLPGDFSKPCLEPSYPHPLLNINKGDKGCFHEEFFITLQLFKSLLSGSSSVTMESPVVRGSKGVWGVGRAVPSPNNQEMCLQLLCDPVRRTPDLSLCPSNRD